ncbi:ABC transporter family substrate-binding protein [Nocardia cyriacigeorgica]|uniref:ABC transporter family substrate-binding protein n=1 Tax=Nocardia cyriacigeorgica TaxID=135487 RepID=UPI00189301B2|nr:ABC transporter family substrate-binding protein [Nocardia cyriacigeorgica]MBF6161504.1 ABC transporter family substrate-binding protein [Nocardia cyriacigeorgica]MBF6200071.1 ABC transporter family substrate-binding protein [Nocardia cyriacigeorgica]
MWRAMLVVMTALLPVVAGCTANPPPPIESTDSPKTTPAEPGKNTVVVAIDDIGIGFNPHLRSDQSPATAAVSSMVLPSPFRPVPDPAVPGATLWVPDSALVEQAEVTSHEPFTITYKLRNQANWSDGAPIAAEDFRFLWRQMITQPGVVDPAGYRLISDVASTAGGKTVTVTMAAPYPAWRQLFANLLPSHLVKDSPGGFQRTLTEGIAVSGGSFKIKSADQGRDEILLERNDRYWGKPAVPDQILLRRGGTPAQVADSLRTGDAQMALVHGGVATQAQLAAIPSVRTAIMPQARELQFVLNGRSGDLVDPRVRTAVLALLDPALLATVGAQTGGWVEPVRAQVLSPSDPGYVPTAPPRPSQDEAFALLAESGFGRAPEPPPVVSATSPAPRPRPVAKDGKSLTIRIGAVANDPTALAVAHTAADQLRSAGIDASVRSVAGDELYGKELVEGTIDAIVGWEVAGSDPGTVLASRYGCPPVTPPGPDGDPDPDAEVVRLAPSNLSGICDPGAQPAVDGALVGIETGRVLAESEPRLWASATVLPIVQDNVVAASGPSVDGASLSGAIQVGIFGDAANWRRVG